MKIAVACVCSVLFLAVSPAQATFITSDNPLVVEFVFTTDLTSPTNVGLFVEFVATVPTGTIQIDP